MVVVVCRVGIKGEPRRWLRFKLFLKARSSYNCQWADRRAAGRKFSGVCPTKVNSKLDCVYGVAGSTVAYAQKKNKMAINQRNFWVSYFGDPSADMIACWLLWTFARCFSGIITKANYRFLSMTFCTSGLFDYFVTKKAYTHKVITQPVLQVLVSVLSFSNM